MRTVLFHREFLRFQGGHLKVWHYFNHAAAAPGHRALVRFTDNSVWDAESPWLPVRDQVLPWDAEVHADVRFLAGRDWRWLDPAERADSPVPVVNLLQQVLHGDPGDPLGRYEFLANRAIRIVTSSAIAEAVLATGRVRGPLFTIPNGIDLEEMAAVPRPPRRDLDLLIVASKQPALGRAIASQLDRGAAISLLRLPVPRSQLLAEMARARVTLFLPNPKEGFYIPAQEGMALETAVVCPDCVGNRSFCTDGVNCFMPAYGEEALVAATRAALARPSELDAMRERALETVREHDLAKERAAFHSILARVDELWATA